MATVKRIVCLANSRKLHGRCVAGREFAAGKAGAWIRPVSDREHEEVSEYERQYKDGSDPRVLDIIKLPLLEPRPKNYQRENWLLDPETYWEKAGECAWKDLDQLADKGGPLWLNGASTMAGLNDEVPADKVNTLTGSLKLVRVGKLGLKVFAPGKAFGNSKRRVQEQFTFAGSDYAIWISDPLIEREYLVREDGEYSSGESYLTVSLAEPYNGRYFKLIAAVILRPKV